MRNRRVHNLSYSIPLIKFNSISTKRLRTQQHSSARISKPIYMSQLANKDPTLINKHNRKINKFAHLNSSLVLQNSNNNISSLNKEILSLQSKFKSMSHYDEQELDTQIKCVRILKEHIQKTINNLKRAVQNNGNTLMKDNQQMGKVESLLSLQKDHTFYNTKLERLTKRNQSAIQNNTKITTKLHKIQQRIATYQSQYSTIISQLQTQTHLQSQLRKRMEQIQIKKKRSKIELKRLQLKYFKKMTDLKYQMDGCQAIGDKIAQLEERILKAQTYMGELNQHISKLVTNSQINQLPTLAKERRRVKSNRVFSQGNSNEYIKQ